MAVSLMLGILLVEDVELVHQVLSTEGWRQMQPVTWYTTVGTGSALIKMLSCMSILGKQGAITPSH